MEAQGNRRLADRWLGRDMKHGFTFDDKSIVVGNMKYAHSIPDVYECAGLTPKRRDWLNGFFARVCVCGVHLIHAHKQPLVILTESYGLLAWNHVSKIENILNSGDLASLILSSLCCWRSAVSPDAMTPTGSCCLYRDLIFFHGHYISLLLTLSPKTRTHSHPLPLSTSKSTTLHSL